MSLEDRLRLLMTQGLAGDAGAQSALLHALTGPLRTYFARRLAAEAEVEDLVQETLIAVHFKRHTYDAGQPFTPWAYAVARHKLTDHFRKAGARAEAPLEDAETLFARDDQAERGASHDLQRLLAALPARQRSLVEDVKITGLSVKEASAKTGMSVAAVKVSLHRAMKAMSRRTARED